MNVLPNQTIAVWFSCGAASAVAAQKTIERYGSSATIRVVNNPVAEEDADNRRFLRDVEQWLGVSIEFAHNPKYPSCSCVDVWAQRRFMSGVGGAPCTIELKKEARRLWEQKNRPDWQSNCLEFIIWDIPMQTAWAVSKRAALPTGTMSVEYTQTYSASVQSNPERSGRG